MAIRGGPTLASVGCVSAGILAFEVILTRIFSLVYWHHFAALLIALALTGFGTAGSLAALTMPRLTRHVSPALAVTALGAAIAMPLSYLAVLAVGLEPLALAWSGRSWFELGLVCLILIVPFGLGAAHLGLALAWAPRTHFLYAANLAGSGVGCLVAALALSLLPPQEALYLAAGLTALGFVFQAPACRPLVRLAGLLAASVLALFLLHAPLPLYFEPFKDRAQALAAQGSALEAQAIGLDGVAEIIGGPAFHFAAGLSLVCRTPLPEQRGLFLDGDLLGPITRVRVPDRDTAFTRCLLGRLPQSVLNPKRVLVLYPGGGLPVLTALDGGAEQVVCLEENRLAARLMTGPMALFSGLLYERPGVRLIQADPWLYLFKTRDRFDLIVLGQGTAWGAGSESGLGVDRFLTVEGLAMLLGRLGPQGGLAVSGPLLTPPRASIKLLATAKTACVRLGLPLKDGLLVARDWQTVLVLIKPSGLTETEVQKAEAEAGRWGFDLAYAPGRGEPTNLVHDLTGRPLEKAIRSILAGQTADLYSQSLFLLKPATRDRPYFHHFFRFRTLPLILNPGVSGALSVVQWGLLFTWGGLAATLLLAGLGIFGPLLSLRPRPRGLLFFSLIGLGYMLAEVTLLSEITFRLGRPALAMPLVVGVFLLVSGLGSLAWGSRRPAIFCLASALTLAAALAGLRHLSGGAVSGALLLAVPALFMGAPFAGGLTHLAGPRPAHRAWAFGVNGFFSVAGALGATLVCLELGHSVAIGLAGGSYLLAGLFAGGKRP